MMDSTPLSWRFSGGGYVGASVGRGRDPATAKPLRAAKARHALSCMLTIATKTVRGLQVMKDEGIEVLNLRCGRRLRREPSSWYDTREELESLGRSWREGTIARENRKTNTVVSRFRVPEMSILPEEKKRGEIGF